MINNDITSTVLYVHEGKFGLPSIDPKCLQLLFYLRLHPNHNIKIKTSGEWASPMLPMLRFMTHLIYDFEEILELLTILVKPTCDEEFDDATKDQIRKYTILNFKYLEKAFVLNFWGYKKNIDYFSNLYSNTIHPNLQKIFIKSLRNYHMEIVTDILGDHTFSDCIKQQNNVVKKYLNFVSVLLKNKKFLFGDSPSTVDVELCGYLAPLMTCNFPNNKLKKILMKHTKIVNYVNNFIEIYGHTRHDATDFDDFGSNHWMRYILICIFIIFFGFGIYQYRNG